MPTLDEMFPRKPWHTNKKEVVLCVCGAVADTKDHFWPQSLGGLRLNNVWRMCRECNIKKASRFPTAEQTLAFCRQRAQYRG